VKYGNLPFGLGNNFGLFHKNMFLPAARPLLPHANEACFAGRVFGTLMDKTITVRVDYIYKSQK
jgi:hypothetical protein